MIINASVVKAERIGKGWTQQQLADVSGLSLRTIQRVENQAQGSMETTNALCAVFNIERQQLITPSDDTGNISTKKIAAIAFSSILLGFLSGVALMFLIQ